MDMVANCASYIWLTVKSSTIVDDIYGSFVYTQMDAYPELHIVSVACCVNAGSYDQCG